MGLLGRLLKFLGFSPPIVQVMVKALDDEIAYIESCGGGIRCSVYNGRLQTKLGENLYTFTIETELAFPDDTPLERARSRFHIRNEWETIDSDHTN